MAVAPLQIGLPPLSVTDSVAGAEENTVRLTALLVAVLGTAHTELAVITQVMLDELLMVELVKTALLLPELTPFTFH